MPQSFIQTKIILWQQQVAFEMWRAQLAVWQQRSRKVDKTYVKPDESKGVLFSHIMETRRRLVSGHTLADEASRRVIRVEAQPLIN